MADKDTQDASSKLKNQILADQLNNQDQSESQKPSDNTQANTDDSNIEFVKLDKGFGNKTIDELKAEAKKELKANPGKKGVIFTDADDQKAKSLLENLSEDDLKKLNSSTKNKHIQINIGSNSKPNSSLQKLLGFKSWRTTLAIRAVILVLAIIVVLYHHGYFH